VLLRCRPRGDGHTDLYRAAPVADQTFFWRDDGSVLWVDAAVGGLAALDKAANNANVSAWSVPCLALLFICANRTRFMTTSYVDGRSGLGGLAEADARNSPLLASDDSVAMGRSASQAVGGM
jgi:hypothetical protein